MTSGSGKFDKYLSIAQQIAEPHKLDGNGREVRPITKESGIQLGDIGKRLGGALWLK